LPLYWRLNKIKTIFSAHDGSVKPTFAKPCISKIVYRLGYGTIRQVNMFSRSQAALFAERFKKVKIYLIPLGLKDFGSSKLTKRNDCVSFFFFGSIHPGKNIGLLIDAACSLREEGLRGFKVSINGSCQEWEQYQVKIKYPELFELNVRMIENSEIPDLFAQNHYMVFPYKEMSQSGALKVAFNYNVPVIVSDLQGFTDEVKEGVNGFVFESENIESLKQVMRYCVEHHAGIYSELCAKSERYSIENYSTQFIVRKYVEMLNEIANL